MTQEQKGQISPEPMPTTEGGSVVLDCSDQDFRIFMSSLLGKPQTIAKMFRGTFDIGMQDLEDLYYLVDQRVCQQNKNHLLQFTCRIVFEDNSSVLMNSFEDLTSYREVRPVASYQVHLTWSYLVYFPDRKGPEKQEIEVSFITRSSAPILVFDNEKSIETVSGKLLRSGIILFSIKHTARTWGADIEALLTGHLGNVLQKPSKLRNFVWKHSTKIALFVFLSFFSASVIVSFVTASYLWKTQKEQVEQYILKKEPVDKKIDFILKTLSAGIWSRYFYAVIVFLIFALVLGIILSLWVEKSADTDKPSFLLLTREAEKKKEKLIRKYEKRWISFIVSIIASICAGVVGNVLFAFFWKTK